MNMPNDNSALAVADLQRSFAGVPAVAGLDLELQRGEMFGLVGPDGAGKSTAIRLLCGILRPTGGSGRVLGFDLAREPEKIKSAIGYLSQNFTLYGDLSIDENLEFFAQLHGVSQYRQRRKELLAFTRLTPFRDRSAQALSGGMKKKLALACALIHTPQILFLDEPSTGVDPVSRGEFWTILSALLDQGITVLMTTPYLDEAERCHRIGLMYRGRLLRTGTPTEIKAALPGRIFRFECPARPAAYRYLRSLWPPAQLVLYGDRLHFWAPGGETEAQQAVDQLAAQDLGPASFTAIEPSLEDVFTALLGPHGDGHE